MKKYDVCIVGGGAAGLAAAASLNAGIKACVIEKNDVPGRKLLATGGGRCNITNTACRGSKRTLEFFRSLGLEIYKDDEGRCYPYSNYAADVTDILIAAVRSRGTDIVSGVSVSGVFRSDDIDEQGRTEREFVVDCGSGENVSADNVVLAMGGKAAPQFGTTGDGYNIAKTLGHSIVKVYPILCPIECGDMSRFKGVRAKGKVGIYRDGELLHEETGEIQFTEDGISGICVFNLTPYIKAEQGEYFKEALSRYKVSLDLAPDFTYKQLAARDGSFGILTGRLAACVGLDRIKRWELPVLGVKGWRKAQCTAGGVSTDEIDMHTMESKLVDGLFFAGEMIDVQGPCGGYNLQNAWETGMKASQALNDRYSTLLHARK